MRTRALMSSTVLFACDNGGGSTIGEIGGGGDGGNSDRSGASLCERGDDNGDVDDGRSVQPSLSKSQPVMSNRGTAERCECRLGSRPEALTEEKEEG